MPSKVCFCTSQPCPLYDYDLILRLQIPRYHTFVTSSDLDWWAFGNLSFYNKSSVLRTDWSHNASLPFQFQCAVPLSRRSTREHGAHLRDKIQRTTIASCACIWVDAKLALPLVYCHFSVNYAVLVAHSASAISPSTSTISNTSKSTPHHSPKS